MTTAAHESRLFVLLPVHNRRQITLQFVTALTRQTWQRFELILIDDGSSDGTAEAVAALWPATDVVRGNGQWWWAGALDQGCRRVVERGVRPDDVLLFINDDVVIEPEFLAYALTELSVQTGTLLLARQLDAQSGAELDQGGGVRADLRELRFTGASRPDEINCLPTRGLFLRWSDYQRTGGFRPERLPHYLSDYEFTLRAKARGLSLRVAQRASLGVKLGESGRSLQNLYATPRAARFGLIFSPRFKDNPVTWSRFVSLAVPPSRRPYLWAKIWANFLLTAFRCVVRPVR